MNEHRQHELLQLDLPEHGQLHLPLAGVGTRAVAALIDAAVLLLIAMAIAVAALALLVGAANELAGPILFATTALLPVVGPLLFELRWQGQTPGKRMMELRVISADGTPASAGQLLLRNVLRLVDFLPFGYFAGLVSVFVSSHNQRLGDLVGGTLVVRESPRALLDLAVFEPAPSSPELHGIPAPLLRAAELLEAPHRNIETAIYLARKGQIFATARQHRPDLRLLDDDTLWTLLHRRNRGAP